MTHGRKKNFGVDCSVYKHRFEFWTRSFVLIPFHKISLFCETLFVYACVGGEMHFSKSVIKKGTVALPCQQGQPQTKMLDKHDM